MDLSLGDSKLSWLLSSCSDWGTFPMTRCQPSGLCKVNNSFASLGSSAQRRDGWSCLYSKESETLASSDCSVPDRTCQFSLSAFEGSLYGRFPNYVHSTEAPGICTEEDVNTEVGHWPWILSGGIWTVVSSLSSPWSCDGFRRTGGNSHKLSLVVSGCVYSYNGHYRSL